MPREYDRKHPELITVKQIVYAFKKKGDGFIPKMATVRYLLDKYKARRPKPLGALKYYFNRYDAQTIIGQHMGELYMLNNYTPPKPPHKEYNSHPIPGPGGLDELSPESYELLKNQEVFYESLKRYINEALEEFDLYHGSQAEFSNFDYAYMSTGWGQQSYGYGFYLTQDKQAAKEYSRGGIIYTVQVPDKPYLTYDGIKRNEAMKIAKAFFKYYTEEDEYGKSAYGSNPYEFWEMECAYIADCSDGGAVYGTIASILGSDEETSRFLNRLGYKGVRWNDDTNEVTNYVIFDQNDIRIVKKERIDATEQENRPSEV